MPNRNHLLIIFNKPIKLGASPVPGYHISAAGSDISRGIIAGHGARFIKLTANSVDLVTIPILGETVLRDKKNKDCVIDKNDVVMIKELETNRIIWTGPTANQIVVELDPASRVNPVLGRTTSGSPIIYIDRNNCIPKSWTVGLDLKNFPFFVKLHEGIVFSEKDANRLEFEFLDDVCPIEKFYVCQVYEKNGGKVLWRKSARP